jgi:predicted ATPase with chaperone activity
MIGPPGSGKTMLAKRMPTILPPFTFEEVLETRRFTALRGCWILAPGWLERVPTALRTTRSLMPD